MKPRPMLPAPNWTAVDAIISHHNRKASGNRRPKVVLVVLPHRFAEIISISSPPNSAIHCRQAPQGKAGGSVSVTSTTAIIRLTPAENETEVPPRSAKKDS